MRLILGDQSIDFSKSEWERAKALILETDWQGDEGEIGVMSDEDLSDNEPLDPEIAMEFLKEEEERLLEMLKALPQTKVTDPAEVLGAQIFISGTRGQFRQQYRDAIKYLLETATGPKIKSVEAVRVDGDHAQHVVTVQENEESDTKVSGDLASTD